MADTEEAPRRTLAELIVKLVTVHVVTTASYAYLCSLQGLNVKSLPRVLRLVFFIFTPTVLVIEAVINLFRTTINFIQDEAEDAETSLGFFVSAALGVQATHRKHDGDDGAKDMPRRVSMLDLSCAKCDKERVPMDWAWAGKILVSIFTLIQGIGTITVWVQRLIVDGTLVFDDRIGLMGIAIVILSIQSLVILSMRYKWTTNQPLPISIDDSGTRHIDAFMFITLAALMLQDFTRSCNYRSSDDHCPVPNPSFFLVKWALPEDIGDFSYWPLLVLGIFVLVFRREVADKINLTGILKVQRRYLIGGRTFSRLRFLVQVVFLLLLASDVIVKVVNDVLQVVQKHVSTDSYDDKYWAQSPLSEALPVL